MCPLTLNTLSPARVNIFGTSRYSLFVLINLPLSLPLSILSASLLASLLAFFHDLRMICS
jgi:hypothetical protein